MSFDHMPEGTFLKIEAVSLTHMSKAAAIARMSFRQRNAGLDTAIVEDKLVACIHIDDGISSELKDMLDAKNQIEKEEK